MSWSYRIVQRRQVIKIYDPSIENHEGSISETAPASLFIAEVYFNDDEEPEGWCECGSPFGLTIDDVRRDLERMSKAFDLPVLILDDDGEGFIGEVELEELNDRRTKRT